MSQFAALAPEIDDDFSPTEQDPRFYPADQDTTLRVIYLDQHGAEHHTSVRTTQSLEHMRADGLRANIERYYECLGCCVLSVQVVHERATRVYEHHPRPQLWVVPKRCVMIILALVTYIVADLALVPAVASSSSATEQHEVGRYLVPAVFGSKP